jgi:V/A-type H+-transporting ATPase subunit E
VAKERLNKQREILFLKDKLIHDTLENVREKLVQFVGLPEYKLYLISTLQKTLKEIDKGNYYIVVLKRDNEKFNIKANEIVAKERLNKQREMLFLKEKLIVEALENVREKLVEFVSFPEYKSYFLRVLENTLKEIDSGKYYIIVLKVDYEKFQSEIEVILNAYSDRNAEIKISEEDFIGGIILKDFEGKFKIDNSIESKLQDSKELIGVRVMEMLA